jgi:hypothetical protein
LNSLQIIGEQGVARERAAAAVLKSMSHAPAA